MVDFAKLIRKQRTEKLEGLGHNKNNIKRWLDCPKHQYRDSYIGEGVMESDEGNIVDVQKGLVCILCEVHKKVWDEVK